MTLDQLRIFLEVAERAHVTRAAEALKMTQSAVSAALRALESTHGVQLFDRVGRGITLTEAGHRFVPAAKSVLNQAETAELILDDLSARPRGRLRIEASQTVATYVLPPVLVRLRQAHPDLSVRLGVGNTSSVARAVADGAADLGFVEGEVVLGDLRTRVVARDELVLVMRRGHPAARSAMSAQAYRKLDWVMREEGSGTRAEVEVHLAQLGLSRDDLAVLLEIPSNEAVLSAVAGSDCVSMVSRRVVDALAEDGAVHQRRVTWAPRPERPFTVLSHPERHRTRAVEALMALIDAG
ncbi:MAG: LysR substrate-binding domain-containing protein [Roseovarius confluentis]|uniref:LysR substrate-binding domain-containing protein n=1 Tax=Roseovarius confluentis TaxID=1852027 RepID=UPI000CDDB323|nr:LysR substrate-binding domain-containing protein [Roseovarius confluentis]